MKVRLHQIFVYIFFLLWGNGRPLLLSRQSRLTILQRKFDFNLKSTWNIQTRSNSPLKMSSITENAPIRVGSQGEYSTFSTSPDDSQSKAITCTDPAVLIVAGPGTGKTRVLSSRLAYLLQFGVCSPNEILVISFTNSAAHNLRKRAEDLLAGSNASVAGTISDTFHGFCSSVIRKHMNLIMSPKSNRELIIADEADQIRIMESLLESKGFKKENNSVSEILKKIRFWKESGLGYIGVKPKDVTGPTAEIAYKLYFDYQLKLRGLSALDFGDLLLYTLRFASILKCLMSTGDNTNTF